MSDKEQLLKETSLMVRMCVCMNVHTTRAHTHTHTYINIVHVYYVLCLDLEGYLFWGCNH